MDFQIVKEKKVQKEVKKVGNKRNGQYEKLCDRISKVQQQIDKMNLDFKKRN